MKFYKRTRLNVKLAEGVRSVSRGSSQTPPHRQRLNRRGIAEPEVRSAELKDLGWHRAYKHGDLPAIVDAHDLTQVRKKGAHVYHRPLAVQELVDPAVSGQIGPADRLAAIVQGRGPGPPAAEGAQVGERVTGAEHHSALERLELRLTCCASYPVVV